MFCIESNGAEVTLKTIKGIMNVVFHVLLTVQLAQLYTKVMQCTRKNVNNKISKHIKVKIVNSPIALHSKYLLQSVGGVVSALQ